MSAQTQNHQTILNFLVMIAFIIFIQLILCENHYNCKALKTQLQEHFKFKIPIITRKKPSERRRAKEEEEENDRNSKASILITTTQNQYLPHLLIKPLDEAERSVIHVSAIMLHQRSARTSTAANNQC